MWNRMNRYWSGASGTNGKPLRRIATMLALVGALLVASAPAIFASAPGEPFIITPDDEPRDVRVVSPFATLRLPNGNAIEFFAVDGERGRVDGVVVRESVAIGSLGIQSSRALQGVSPLEIFNAFAEPGMRVPRLLEDLYPAVELGSRGWARDLAEVRFDAPVLPAHHQTCPSWAVSQWSDGLHQYQELFGSTFTSTWDGPNSKPQHWTWTGGLGQGDLSGYKLVGQATSSTAFYGSVLYCWEDIENAFYVNGTYGGNYVRYYMRQYGNQPWLLMQSGQLSDVGQIESWLYYPANALSFTAPTYTFRMEIANAKPADDFHIGAAWRWKADSYAPNP